MAAEHGGRGSGKSESFFQQAALHTNAHTYIQDASGEQYTYAVPKTGIDTCPSCGKGNLRPVGQSHDEVHLVCRDNDCGMNVHRPKHHRLTHFLEGD